MDNTYGRNLKLKVTGASHAPKMTVELENFPCGFKIDIDELNAFLQRRAPGKNAYSTQRKEPDAPIFLSGVDDDFVTTGEKIVAEILNTSQRSSDYNFNDTPRPSHADFCAVSKFGSNVDLKGGGKYSGRLTAMMCIAGGICKQYLKSKGVDVFAHIYSIGNICDTPFDLKNVGTAELKKLQSAEFPTLDENAAVCMKELIEECRLQGDSIGGVIECALTNLDIGLGDHMFNGVESRISSIVFEIPAIKGVEFGLGFGTAALKGSQNNDAFCVENGKVRTSTNNCGGILGGMTNGMPLVFRGAVKPTPSISIEQNTVSISKMENTKIQINGRHDPCIVPRCVPVFEAAAAIAICDMMLDD